MAEIISGQDALDTLESSGNTGGNDKEFSSFKGGSKYVVKAIGTNDLFGFYNYGIYSKGGGGVPSFVAKKPSKKSDKGFPQEDLTSWDKAFLHHYENSKEFGDKESNEAYKYKPKLRFALGFFDLDSGERIVIDVSKNQANAIRKPLLKQAEKGKLGKVAFELEKESDGSVSLTPIVDLDDLTSKQQENFDKAPEEFKIEDFHGVNFEADEDEMLRRLVQSGFDVTKIGYEIPKPKEADGEGEKESAGEPLEISSDDLPF
ncbi:hypothetical protein [Oceanobacillus neutriphilus]|uniref:Single-stranded DNA-binding protein n=1 Tax=Oceanobacillus neutriphilus TaxID=531815 RepID=A0ABQ2NY74_9BACI|nr:hypothetical protein [Oceanobacillus neutriphilus]GGP13484.1 hypothetical protein GCM10011346_33660 [Oceanobacillus neutriphilus]